MGIIRLLGFVTGMNLALFVIACVHAPAGISTLSYLFGCGWFLITAIVSGCLGCESVEEFNRRQNNKMKYMTYEYR